MKSEYERHLEGMNIEVQVGLNPYLSLWMGEKVLLSEIIDKAPYTLEAVSIMQRNGTVVSQSTMDGDTVLTMPGVRKRGETLDEALMNSNE